MQVIAGASISNAHGIYFPSFYSPFANMVMEDLLHCDCDTFKQVLYQEDVLYLQINTDDNPRIEIVYQNQTYTFNSVSTSGSLKNFAIPMSLFSGTIFLNLIIDSGLPPSTVLSQTSAPIEVLTPEDQSNRCYALVEWRSECVAYGIDYTIDPDFFHRMRLPLRYFRPAPQSQSKYNVTKQSDGYWEFCSSDLDEVWTFAIDQIPDWMFQVLEKAILHSTFLINGTEFFGQAGAFRKTERRCCNYQVEGQVTPRLQDHMINDCCINDFTGFIQSPQIQLNCGTSGMNQFIDTRGSSDSNNNIIDNTSTGINYIFQFGTFYIATISATSDPTVYGSWTFNGGSGSEADFQANIIDNISLPTGGFAGYFELGCDGLIALEIENMSVVVTIFDSNEGATSNGGVCTISCDLTQPECPVADLSNSAQPDINNITISNVGTQDTQGNAIHNDGDYTFAHTFTPTDCASTTGVFPLFTVTGLGGTNTLAFSNWHPTISGNAAVQANVQAEFTGGMDATGYTFDKEAVINALAAGGLNVGGAWCVDSQVTHDPTGCQDTTQLEIISDLQLQNFALHWEGVTPTQQTSTLTGLARYESENGIFGFGTIGPELASEVFFIEGSTATNVALGAQISLDVEFNSGYAENYDYQDNGIVYVAQQMENNSGLKSFSDGYFNWDAAGNTSFARIFNVASVNIGMTASFGSGILIRHIFESGGLGTLGGEAISSVAYDVQRFALGGGDITATGTDDPSAGTGTPLVATIAAGGTAHPFTVGATNMQLVVNSPVEGTYYVRFFVQTTGGLILTNIASFNLVNV